MARFRIVTGGQTGVDRTALDAARSVGISCGGWCPSGRRAEDGAIAAGYPLRETPSGDYAQRTRWNVRDSDGTLILVYGALIGGTRYTLQHAHLLNRPVQVVQPDLAQIQTVLEWCHDEQIGVLNIAGPRASTDVAIYGQAYRFLSRLFEAVSHPMLATQT